MGSKTPESHQQIPQGALSNEVQPVDPRSDSAHNGSSSADLDRGVIDDDDGDDENDSVHKGTGLRVAENKQDTEKKKKKKKKNRKRSKKHQPTQPSPPRVLVSTLFPSGCPSGELVRYENTSRISDSEHRYNSRLWDEGFLDDYREAAEIHRQARKYAQEELIKPGATLLAIAEGIENGVRAMCGHPGLETGDCLKAGLAFPTGLCLNNVAAHWTPNPGGKDVVLGQDDVLTVDFGVHVNGRIVDSAFTVSFDETYENLVEAVRAATNSGIHHAGVDARISEVSTAIQETMESYEVEVDGKVRPVRAVRNLTGHDILPYQIHGGKQIPFVKNNSRDKMEEGEVFAIETFGSTGKGYLHDDVGVYGYGRQKNVSAVGLPSTSAKTLLKTIDQNFGTLPFSRRYLERLGTTKYHLGMKNLVDNGIVECYAPLVEVKGAQTAQFEHTILLHSCGKEVISRGEDY